MPAVIWGSEAPLTAIISRIGFLSVGYHRNLMACRLCRVVAFAIFAAVVAIEAAILVPSYRRAENDLVLQIEREGLAVVRAHVGVYRPSEDNEAFLHAVAMSYGSVLQGGIVYSASTGQLIGEFGEKPDPTLGDPVGEYRRRSADGRRLDIAWREAALGAPIRMVARLDATRIDPALRAFVFRISGLVLLIAAFATAVAMFVIGWLVLSPMLRLRQAACDAAADPDRPERYSVGRLGRYEIGEMAIALDHMLRRMAEANTERRLRAEAERDRLANRDQLTGLHNRAYFLRHVGERIAAGSRFSVVLLDIDRFSVVNAAYGSQAGDAVLVEAARRLGLGRVMGAGLARISADQFAVALPVQQSGEDEAFASMMMQATEPSALLGDHEIKIVTSVGISVYPDDATDAEGLVNAAALAVDIAQADGGGRIRFFRTTINERLKRHRLIERALSKAIQRGQITLHFQPKFSVPERSMIGVEALMRWHHPEHGPISPGEFIPIAEESGQIVELGNWALKTACAQVATWRRDGWREAKVAVNLSAVQFREPRLPETIAAVLEESGLPPSSLELEITESAIVGEPEAAARTVAAIASTGVAFSIDDFGTGFSSLSYLKTFRVDTLKIDRSFVKDLETDPQAEVMLGSIVSLGRALALKTVAEGVETVGQMNALVRAGCDAAQGYLLAKPMPPQAILPLIYQPIPPSLNPA